MTRWPQPQAACCSAPATTRCITRLASASRSRTSRSTSPTTTPTSRTCSRCRACTGSDSGASFRTEGGALRPLSFCPRAASAEARYILCRLLLTDSAFSCGTAARTDSAPAARTENACRRVLRRTERVAGCAAAAKRALAATDGRGEAMDHAIRRCAFRSSRSGPNSPFSDFRTPHRWCKVDTHGIDDQHSSRGGHRRSNRATRTRRTASDS